MENITQDDSSTDEILTKSGEFMSREIAKRNTYMQGIVSTNNFNEIRKLIADYTTVGYFIPAEYFSAKITQILRDEQVNKQTYWACVSNKLLQESRGLKFAYILRIPLVMDVRCKIAKALLSLYG